MEPETQNPKVEPLTELAVEFVGLAEQAYDRGYDDGWKARDEMAGRALKEAEDLAFDNGFVAGVNATINRRPHNPIDGQWHSPRNS